MGKGVWDIRLRNIAIAFALLLVMLAAVYRIAPMLRSAGAHCTADIVTMHNLPAGGKGIRCPTEEFEVRGGTGTSATLARELARCAEKFGWFRYDPFHGTQAGNICLMCSTGMVADEFSDVDVALLEEQRRGVTAYQQLTGKIPSTYLRGMLRKTPDEFPQGEYAIVWLRSSRPTVDAWLSDWGRQRKGELWHGNVLELPGDERESTIMGIGNGIFRPDGEGLNQAVLLLWREEAEQQGCVELGDAPFKPVT